MMNRGNMGKQITTPGMMRRTPAVMPPRPGMPGTMGPGRGMAPGMPQAGMMAAAAEAMRNRQAMGMKKGGKVAKKADGGAVKGYAKGGMASRGDGCCMKGKTKGTMR